MDEKVYSDELQHHGILGMKWGVRRYQNKDGTLKPAGVKRYNKEMDKLKEEQRILNNQKRTAAKLEKMEAMKQDIEEQKRALKEKDKIKKEEEKKEETKTEDTSSKSSGDNMKPEIDINDLKKKSVKKMSDEELNSVIERLKLEQKYAELTSPKAEEKESKGKKWMMDVLEKSGSNIATQAMTFVMGTAVNKVLSGIVDDEKAVNPKKGQKDK